MRNSRGLKKNLSYSVPFRKSLIEPGLNITITRQAELLGIARSSVYTVPTPLSSTTLMLQKAIDEIYTAHPYYGTRRMVVTLARDHGITAGRDAVRSAMQVLGLTALYTAPKTSISHPEHKVFPYLLRGIIAGYPNHVWGTDITYIRLADGFCYLVVIIDWYSRRVLSWHLSNSLETSFCTETLREALSCALPDIHNSDQGVQFTSAEYLQELQAHESIAISMDGRGRCMDNIFTERLWRTVKYEDVYLKGYATMDEVRKGLDAYFRFYNTKRPHQSLDYRTPDELYYQTTKTLKNEIRARGSLSTKTV
jgi:putative transposase